MINTLIIFLTQHFQGKKSDLLVKISPFNQRVKMVHIFLKLFCPSMNEMDEKKTSRQLLQARCRVDVLGRKGFFD